MERSSVPPTRYDDGSQPQPTTKHPDITLSLSVLSPYIPLFLMRYSRPSVRLSVQASCLSSSVLPPLLPECRPAEFFPWEGLTTVIAVEVLSPWHPSYSIDRVPPSFRTKASRSGALVVSPMDASAILSTFFVCLRLAQLAFTFVYAPHRTIFDSTYTVARIHSSISEFPVNTLFFARAIIRASICPAPIF